MELSRAEENWLIARCLECDLWRVRINVMGHSHTELGLVSENMSLGDAESHARTIGDSVGVCALHPFVELDLVTAVGLYSLQMRIEMGKGAA